MLSAATTCYKNIAPPESPWALGPALFSLDVGPLLPLPKEEGSAQIPLFLDRTVLAVLVLVMGPAIGDRGLLGPTATGPSLGVRSS
jgi:hypothetical protein